ncbi:MAG: hypothetical protein EXQ96_01185 [Alphaproteobacteria bacterium]|nr:hypothetical protein [Alphaproteobacteria bacterium]
MSVMVGVLTVGLVVALAGMVASFLLLRRVNQKCNAMNFIMKFDALFARIITHDLKLNGERAKLASARQLRAKIEDLCPRQGMLPEALLMAALLNDVGRTLAALDWDAVRLRNCLRHGEVTSSRSTYLDVLANEPADVAVADALVRFASDIGRPMPRAIRKVICQTGDGAEVGEVIEHLMSAITGRISGPRAMGPSVHELQAAARTILPPDSPPENAEGKRLAG